MSDKDLGKCICAGAGDEWLGRVEGHIMNGLVVLLPVGRDLLHARPVVQHPQAHRAVVACGGQRERGITVESSILESFTLLNKLFLMYSFFCSALHCRCSLKVSNCLYPFLEFDGGEQKNYLILHL